MRLLALAAALFLWASPAPAEFAGRASVIFGNTATAATATGVGEQTLATFSLPANALNVVGRRLHAHVVFSTAANTNTKTFRLYFGAQVLVNATAASAAGSMIDIWVTKSGSNTQIVTGFGSIASAAAHVMLGAAGTETDTAAIVIKATCQDGTSAAADCVLQDFFIEWMN